MSSSRYSRTIAAILSLAWLGLSVQGCKPDAAVKDPGLIGRGVRAPIPLQVDPGQGPGPQPGAIQIIANGSISGDIIFNSTAPTATINTGMDPACAAGGKATLPTEQFVVNDHKLANVFIYVKSGPPAALMGGTVTAQPVVMDQIHCQYVPHVIAVAAGGYVEFRNSDPTMHNVHTNPVDVGNETIDISTGPHGQPTMKRFVKPEAMIPVRCNNHPWMNAFINVSPTRFYDVSDGLGHFDLRGLPPGDYVIAAVHEKLGEKTMRVTVTSHDTANAEFSFAQ